MCPAWDGGAQVDIKEVNTVSTLGVLSPEGKEGYKQEGYLEKGLCTGGKSLIMEAHGQLLPGKQVREPRPQREDGEAPLQTGVMHGL